MDVANEKKILHDDIDLFPIDDIIAEEGIVAVREKKKRIVWAPGPDCVLEEGGYIFFLREHRDWLKADKNKMRKKVEENDMTKEKFDAKWTSKITDLLDSISGESVENQLVTD